REIDVHVVARRKEERHHDDGPLASEAGDREWDIRLLHVDEATAHRHTIECPADRRDESCDGSLAQRRGGAMRDGGERRDIRRVHIGTPTSTMPSMTRVG